MPLFYFYKKLIFSSVVHHTPVFKIKQEEKCTRNFVFWYVLWAVLKYMTNSRKIKILAVSHQDIVYRYVKVACDSIHVVKGWEAFAPLPFINGLWLLKAKEALQLLYADAPLFPELFDSSAG